MDLRTGLIRLVGWLLKWPPGYLELTWAGALDNRHWYNRYRVTGHRSTELRRSLSLRYETGYREILRPGNQLDSKGGRGDANHGPQSEHLQREPIR